MSRRVLLHIRGHGKPALRAEEKEVEEEATSVITMTRPGGRISADWWTVIVAHSLCDILCRDPAAKPERVVKSLAGEYAAQRGLFLERLGTVAKKATQDPASLAEWASAHPEEARAICDDTNKGLPIVCQRRRMGLGAQPNTNPAKLWRHLVDPLELSVQRGAHIPDASLFFEASTNHLNEVRLCDGSEGHRVWRGGRRPGGLPRVAHQGGKWPSQGPGGEPGVMQILLRRLLRNARAHLGAKTEILSSRRARAPARHRGDDPGARAASRISV